MSGGSSSLFRLWALRLLLFLLAAVVVVGLSFLPAGMIIDTDQPVRLGNIGEVRSDPTQPFRLVPQEEAAPQYAVRWSFEQYGQVLRLYGEQLVNGKLMVRNWYGTMPGIQPLLPLVKETWLSSLSLFCMALGAGLLVGVLLGGLILGSGLSRFLSVGLSVVGMAIPDFLLVILGQMLTIWSFRSFGIRLWSVLGVQGGERGWVLPLVALSIVPMAYTARLLSTALDEVMREEYIRTARAKGVSEFWVVAKHGLRNAAPRFLNGVPGMLNVTLSSLLVVELLTNHYGLGSGLMRGLAETTPHVVATTGLVFAAWFMLMDGLANSLRSLANPRLKGVGE